jgi:hypothetical protein
MQPPRERIVRIERRQDASIVAKLTQLCCKRLDVTRDTAWVRPRVRRDEGDPHAQTLAARAVSL